MTMRDRLRQDLTVAMKRGDRRRVSVLRSALSALANAEAVVAPRQSSTPVAFGTTEVPRRELDEVDARALLLREVAEMETAASDLRRHQRVADADELAAQAAILAEYLDG